MTHEPECQKADLGCGQYPCVEVCMCDELRAAYQRVRELHRPQTHTTPLGNEFVLCAHCSALEGCGCCSEMGSDYPCPTIKVLDGEQA